MNPDDSCDQRSDWLRLYFRLDINRTVSQNVVGNTDPRFIRINSRSRRGNPLASVSQTDVGLFITDDWRVNQKLTLSFGLRYENQTNINDNLNFAPRFGFAFSPGAGGAREPKTVFRGGFGIFYDRFSENYTLNADRHDGVNQQQYVVTDPAIARTGQFSPDNGVTNVPTAAQLATIAPLTQTIRNVSPDVAIADTIQGAFGVERQLPYKHQSFGILYLVEKSSSAALAQYQRAGLPAGINLSRPRKPRFNALRPDPTRGKYLSIRIERRF